MPDIQIGLRRVPSIVPDHVPDDVPRAVVRNGARHLPAMSDEECIVRLAQAVADHDSGHLDEVARLIGRLVVTIE